METIKKILPKLILPAVWILVAAGGVLLGMNWNNIFGKGSEENVIKVGNVEDDGAVDWEGNHSVYKGETEQKNIQLPGFDRIWFKAGVKEQKVNLHNPEENNCYFKMTLYLPDGTKIWTSDLLAPGKGLYDITLDKELEEGEYEQSVLKYECFTYDDNQSQLNGAEMKLTIKVVK